VLEPLEAAVEGSSPSFEDFYVREYPAVVGLAYALSGSRWGAEDLAQEAFLAAHRQWDRIGSYDQPGAWVRRVVANLSVSSFRRRAAEAKALARFALTQAPPLPTSPRATHPSGRPCERSPVGRPRWWPSSTWRTDPSPTSPRSST
jgi:DNA-directed RNA polymerase specialized sigma24 family protein